MPRYVKDGHVVETENAREGVRLNAAGYVVQDGQRSSGTSPRRKVANVDPSAETA